MSHIYRVGLNLFVEFLLFNILFICLLISFLLKFACKTDFAWTLPFCLNPKLIVYFLKLGTSIIPLDELPNTKLQIFINE